MNQTGYHTPSGGFVPGMCGKQTLTKREWKIIKLVAAGMTNKAIAEKLGMSEHMVKNYMRPVYDKLGFSNRVELALWFIREIEGGQKKN